MILYYRIPVRMKVLVLFCGIYSCLMISSSSGLGDIIEDTRMKKKRGAHF